MAGQFHSSSSGSERGQVNQQVHSESHHCSAMGNISGGIMRFNISAYNQPPDIDRTRVQRKKDSHPVSPNIHGSQVASDVKDVCISPTNSQKSVKA